MSLPIIAGIYRVTLDWEGPNRIAENVIHVGTAGNTAFVLEQVLGSLEANMWQCVSSDYKIASLSATPLDGSLLTLSLTTAGFTSSVQGQGGSEFIPNASALVKHTTNVGGRSGRGRTYLPALAEDRTSDGMVAPAQRDLTTAAWMQFLTNLNETTPTIAMVIASYTNASAALVVQSTCEDPIATQRRRNKRVA